MIKKVHHIAFLVKDTERVKELFGIGLKLPLFKEVVLDSLRIKVTIYRIGEVLVEFIAPLSEESYAYKYLKEKGEGFFHMAMETDALDDDVSALRSVGVEIPDTVPKEGVDWKIVDMDPKSTLGIYFQLVVSKLGEGSAST